MAVREHPTYDVVVVGGGPAGIVSALAAARMGATVLLIESSGFVGGVAAMGLPIQGLYANNEERIVEGIPWELMRTLLDAGVAADVRNVGVGPPRGKGSPKYNARWISYHPEAFKFVALDKLHEAGVQLLFHTTITGVTVDGSRVSAVSIQGKSGPTQIRCTQLVDCTGDGDIATMAGAPYEKSEASQRQPMTMTFTMSNVDIPKAVESGAAFRHPHDLAEAGPDWHEGNFGSYDVRLHRWSDEIRQAFPDYGDIITEINIKDLCDGVYHGGNMLHIPGLDGSDTEELSRAEAESRRLVFRIGLFMREHVPGFEASRMVNTSARIGVRETRRIMGDYVLTYDDVIEGRRFDDVIALGGYRVDIHGYDGGPVYVEPNKGTQVKDLGTYDLPFRILIPKNVQNVLVAGRSASATHEAQGSLRVMGTAMAMGQAAGTAAALAADRGTEPRQLAVAALQESLRTHGAKLEPNIHVDA